jgi:hypothetical protein
VIVSHTSGILDLWANKYKDKWGALWTYYQISIILNVWYFIHCQIKKFKFFYSLLYVSWWNYFVEIPFVISFTSVYHTWKSAKIFAWFNLKYLKGSSGAHNFATIDGRTVKLFCGHSIPLKLSIHVSHFEIGVKNFFLKLEVYQFLVSKKFNMRRWRYTPLESTMFIRLNFWLDDSNFKLISVICSQIMAIFKNIKFFWKITRVTVKKAMKAKT